MFGFRGWELEPSVPKRRENTGAVAGGRGEGSLEPAGCVSQDGEFTLSGPCYLTLCRADGDCTAATTSEDGPAASPLCLYTPTPCGVDAAPPRQRKHRKPTGGQRGPSQHQLLGFYLPLDSFCSQAENSFIVSSDYKDGNSPTQGGQPSERRRSLVGGHLLRGLRV